MSSKAHLAPAALAVQYRDMSKSIPDDLSALRHLSEGKRAELTKFSRANAAACGVMVKAIGSRLFPGFSKSIHAQQTLRRCLLRCRMEALQISPLQKDFTVGPTTKIERHDYASVPGHTKVSTSITGHGVRFKLKVNWELVDPKANTILTATELEEDIHIKPTADRKYPYVVTMPPPKEFYIGEAFALWFSGGEMLDLSDYGVLYELTVSELCAEDACPRHNDRTEAIEQALAQMREFVDYHTHALHEYTRAIGHACSSITVPWAPHFWEDKPEAKVEDVRVKLESAAVDADGDKPMVDTDKGNYYVLGANEVALLNNFFDQRETAMLNIGAVSNALQRLYLLKACVNVVQLCYESIDSTMFEALYAAVGPQHAGDLKAAVHLDTKFHDVGLFHAKEQGMPLQTPKMHDADGYQVELRVKFPGGYYKPVGDAICREREFSGVVRFDGSSSKGVAVRGTFKRYAMAFPTCKHLDNLPAYRYDLTSSYMNNPVGVVVGKPGNGDDLDVQAAFILKSGLMAQVFLETGAIPSNKTHNDALGLLTDSLASLASGLRACDMANSALVVHVVPLRKLLAYAIGLRTGDLAGDWKFEDDLVNCVNAGCSLRTIRQEAADGEIADGDRPAYVALVKQRVRDLLKSVLERGALDMPEEIHAPRHPRKAVAQTRSGATRGTTTAMGGGDGPAFRSLSGVDEDASACDGEDCDDLGDAAEAADATAAAEAPKASAAVSTKNFTANLMKKLDADPSVDPTGYSAAKITLSNPEKHLKFAESRFRPHAGKPVIRPTDAEYAPHPQLASVTGSVAGLFRAYKGSEPIEAEAFTFHALFTHVTDKLLTDLAAGSRDPTVVHYEHIAALDRAMTA